jgi:hypothetical protein
MAGIRNSLHVETQPRQDNQADLNRTVLSVPSREYWSKPYACGLFLTTPSVVVLRPTLLTMSSTASELDRLDFIAHVHLIQLGDTFIRR